MVKNKTGKYLKYAIGEIILVVIGILIALQVNNWNIDKTDKKRELKYLTNIVLDLKKDIKSLNDLMEFRKNRLIGDQKIIDHMNGIPVDNLNELAKNIVNSMMERNFTPNNTTFLELSNSGNLNLISNDSIKFLLLELEELYKTNKLSIEHETFDYREYISKSANRNIDVDLLIPVYMGLKTIEEQKITLDSFKDLLNIREYKNGLFIMTFLSDGYIKAYENMKAKSEKIIRMIELAK
tara:strand:- start:46361 stop:47074 length:714 start_codon:yes stop_codon:yes gene_type:complete